NRLESKNLVVGDVTERTSADIPEGNVIATDPEAGTTVDEGTAVDLIVSAGPEQVTIPNLTSYSYKEAKELLEGDSYGLKVKRQDVDSDQPKGRVLNSNPPEGSQVDRGSTVTLMVSKGQVEVPDVTGREVDDAVKNVDALALKVTVQEDASSEAPDGMVVDHRSGLATLVDHHAVGRFGGGVLQSARRHGGRPESRARNDGRPPCRRAPRRRRPPGR